MEELRETMKTRQDSQSLSPDWKRDLPITKQEC
jgi:hypothetical protein